MSNDLFSEISDKNEQIDKKWNLSLNSRSNLAKYRQEKLHLLNRILENTDGLDSGAACPELCKLGISIACQITRTRITETTSDGYRITEPSLVSEDIRDFCIRSYDRLLSYIRQYDRMYIADIPERTAPDSDKRISLLRLYDAKKHTENDKAQADNAKINRLFGSRG